MLAVHAVNVLAAPSSAAPVPGWNGRHQHRRPLPCALLVQVLQRPSIRASFSPIAPVGHPGHANSTVAMHWRRMALSTSCLRAFSPVGKSTAQIHLGIHPCARQSPSYIPQPRPGPTTRPGRKTATSKPRQPRPSHSGITGCVRRKKTNWLIRTSHSEKSQLKRHSTKRARLRSAAANLYKCGRTNCASVTLTLDVLITKPRPARTDPDSNTPRGVADRTPC